MLDRQFEPKAQNRAWARDVTSLATHAAWAYLAVIPDLFSRRVVGWAVSDTNDHALGLG